MVTVRCDGGPLDGDVFEVDPYPGSGGLPPRIIRPEVIRLDERAEVVDWRLVPYLRAWHPAGEPWQYVPL